MILEVQDAVGEQHRHHAEDQHGHGVTLPGVLAARIDAQQLVGEPLDWPEDGFKESILAVEHLEKVDAERFGDEEQNPHVEGELNPAGCVHKN